MPAPLTARPLAEIIGSLTAADSPEIPVPTLAPAHIVAHAHTHGPSAAVREWAELLALAHQAHSAACAKWILLEAGWPTQDITAEATTALTDALHRFYEAPTSAELEHALHRTPGLPGTQAPASRHLSDAECQRELARATECAHSAMFTPATHHHEGKVDCWTAEETWARFARLPHNP